MWYVTSFGETVLNIVWQVLAAHICQKMSTLSTILMVFNFSIKCNEPCDTIITYFLESQNN